MSESHNRFMAIALDQHGCQPNLEGRMSTAFGAGLVLAVSELGNICGDLEENWRCYSILVLGYLLGRSHVRQKTLRLFRRLSRTTTSDSDTTLEIPRSDI